MLQPTRKIGPGRQQCHCEESTIHSGIAIPSTSTLRELTKRPGNYTGALQQIAPFQPSAVSCTAWVAKRDSAIAHYPATDEEVDPRGEDEGRRRAELIDFSSSVALALGVEDSSSCILRQACAELQTVTKTASIVHKPDHVLMLPKHSQDHLTAMKTAKKAVFASRAPPSWCFESCHVVLRVFWQHLWVPILLA